MNKEDYIKQLRDQAKRIYVQMKAGYRINDSDRYRSEGFINAGIVLGVITREEAKLILEELHQQVIGVSTQQRKAQSKEDWNEPRDYTSYDSPPFTRK